jgi:hypothetical protein
VAKVKGWYSDQVLFGLREQFPNRDLKIDPREILIRLDQLVNARAKASFVERFKGGFPLDIDEQYLTRYEWLTVTDPANKAPSYVTLSSNYVDLPNNMGIENVYFKNDFSAVKKKYFDPVIITSFKNIASYRNSMANGLEGRISCYVKGRQLTFDRGNIGTTYGDVGVSLVVRNFETLSDSDPYPVPADQEDEIVQLLIEFFRERLMQPQDLIRDSVDKPV